MKKFTSFTLVVGVIMTLLLWMPIKVNSQNVSTSQDVLTMETMNTSSLVVLEEGKGRQVLSEELRGMRILGVPVLQNYLQALQKLAGELSETNLKVLKETYQKLPKSYKLMFTEINGNVTKAYNAKVKWISDAEAEKLQAQAAAAAAKAAEEARQAVEAAAQQAAAEAVAQQQAQAEAAAAAEAAAQQQAQAQADAAAVASQAEAAPQEAAQGPAVVPEDHTAVAPVVRAAPAMQPNTIAINGQWIGLEDSQGSAAAPYDGNAGYWMGSGSTTDGATTHIIGHNPGIFNTVLYLGIGSQVTVVDRNGNSRTYTVYALYDVNDAGNDRNGNAVWGSILGQTGESISLQTCIDDYWNRMVLAK